MQIVNLYNYVANHGEPIDKVLWSRLLHLATIKLMLSSQAVATSDTCVTHVSEEHKSGLAELRYVKHVSLTARTAVMHAEDVPLLQKSINAEALPAPYKRS